MSLKLVVLVMIIVVLGWVMGQVPDFAGFEKIYIWLTDHVVLLILGLLILKFMGSIYPPMPGVVATLAAIPIMGWLKAYLVDVIGGFFGASGAYFLGSRFGVKLLNWLLGEDLIQKILKIKVKTNNQIEASFVLRSASGGSLSDGLAWGASLIGLRYKPFILGYMLSHIITTMPVFLIAGMSLKIQSWWIAIPVVSLAWWAMYKLKGRYFE